MITTKMLNEIKIPYLNDVSIAEYSDNKPVMITFLRHFGCIFCREALQDISNNRSHFEQKGINLLFIHPATPEIAQKYFLEFDLESVPRISDPDCEIYKKFGLVKGTFNQLFGLKNWIRGFENSIKGNLPTIQQLGDGFQMPGIFIVDKGRIRESYIHKFASDRPNYNSLIQCCAS